jgi:3-aminobutyryl-CoA ammonia-lyase
MEAKIRIRLNQSDAHYGGNLVDGARILGLFGDVATEILIRHDGDEGLFVAYDLVEFKAPVYAGDYVEVLGKLEKVGNTFRRMVFEAYKVIEANVDPKKPYLARVLEEPLLVTRATGKCVVPINR